MKIAGHSSIIVSQRYVHPTPERMESAFAQMEAMNQIMRVTKKPVKCSGYLRNPLTTTGPRL